MSDKVPPSATEGLPLHGGDIQAASKRYGIAPDQWIDLSTGVAPNSYPIPAIPNDVYHRLPYPSKSLAKAVVHYYGQEGLAVAGSQAAIQALPYCLAKHPVLLPSIGYEEHKRHWSYAGNAVHFYPSLYPSDAKQAIDDYLAQSSPMHLVLINPNNPTALEFSAEQINEWAARMHEDAYIIVDEAFADVNPELSLLQKSNGAEQNTAGHNRIIVLRSFGKFFGLAGIRLGFVFANAFVKRRLEERLGSWGVNGPAQIIAEQALLNTQWQQHQRANIAASSQQLTAQLLEMLEHFQHVEARDKNAINSVDMRANGLFTSLLLPQQWAEELYTVFAQNGILLRYVSVNNSADGKDEKAMIRIGLPKEDEIRRLAEVCKLWSGVGASQALLS